VIEVGEGVTKVKEGDLIYSSADHVEYVTIPEDWLYVRLPESVDPRQAALFGMASVAMRTCRNADIRMGERVLVVGAGFIGQIAAQIATVMGGRVTLCDINDRRLEVARRIGAAEEVVNVDGEEAWRNGIPEAAFPVVIDVAGVPGMENKLILAAGHRGRLVLIAGRFEVRYDFNVGQGREICIRQNSHFDTSDLENLCRLVERSLVQIEPMIQDVVPVEDAQGIYETLRDRPGELYGTVFEW
jgi:2-desacetyl-2-hydroxyethyl bacteriochlorophyllide A dehydrogenase